MSDRVLLVCEEETGLQGSLAAALAAGGHVVQATKAIADTREALERCAFDVVLLDLQATGAEPFAIIEEVRHVRASADLVVLTEYRGVDAAVAAMARGAADYVIKPIRLDELEVRLQRLREIRDQRLELGRLRAILYDGDTSQTAPVPPFELHLDGLPEVDLPELVKQFETELVEWQARRAAGTAADATRAMGEGRKGHAAAAASASTWKDPTPSRQSAERVKVP